MNELRKDTAAKFVGINSLVYRVEDMDLCHRFFDDWGLRTVKRTDDEVVFETRQGPGIVLKNLHTQEFMFPSPQPGSTLSEVVWGVASQQDLDTVAEELTRDRPVHRSSDGSVHSIDPFGYGIGFGNGSTRARRRRTTSTPAPRARISSATAPASTNRRPTTRARSRRASATWCSRFPASTICARARSSISSA